MLKIVALTADGTEFARQVPSTNDHATKQENLRQSIDDLCFHITKYSELTLTEVRVNENERTEAKAKQTPKITNICGKLIHPHEVNIYSPGIRPFISEQHNCFGQLYCVYTTACNFHTGFSQSSTLFRGGGCREDIQLAIDHVFGASVDSTFLHMLVSSARLGHPVMAKNDLMMLMLSKAMKCSVTRCVSTDECMFLHAFRLQLFPHDILSKYSLEHMQDLSIRINLCRTGMINCFVSVPGGTDWKHNPQCVILDLCNDIYETIWKST